MKMVVAIARKERNYPAHPEKDEKTPD